jgi:23S rRNA pseudouridine2605 synthase
VAVNGVTASLGDSADTAADVITLDGQPLQAEKRRYILLNKPAGYVTTLSDPQGRPTVMDLVDVPERVYPVGRLDSDTEGLLLLTNDGLFSHRIAHPRYEMDKVYVAEVVAPLPEQGKKALETGIELKDGRTRPAQVRLLTADRRMIEIIIHEGRNRMVRRMLEAVGSSVTRLERTRLGPLDLTGVPRGKWRDLQGRELDAMLQALAEVNRAKRATMQRPQC